MIQHEVTVHPEANRLPRQDQLAWKIAAVATDPVPVEPGVAEIIVNRIIRLTIPRDLIYSNLLSILLTPTSH